MNNEKNQEQFPSKVWKAIKVFTATIGVLCNILTLLVVINSSDKTLADIGVISSQLKMAEEYKSNHDYTNALSLYKKVLNKDVDNKYYVAYSIGKIYSEKLPEKEYGKAWKYYTIAMESDDIDILKCCLAFVMEQYRLFKNEMRNDAINILDHSDAEDDNKKSNIQRVKDLLNKINEVDSSFSDAISSEFPVSSEEQIRDLFNSEWEIKSYRWKYVSTKYSYNGAESFENEKEKLVLVDSFSESIDETLFSTATVYKYFRYKIVMENDNKLNIFEIMEDYYKDKKEPIISLRGGLL